MIKENSLLLVVTMLIPLPVLAQDISHNQVQKTQQQIQSTIKGTLDGSASKPSGFNNRSRQLVFPRALNKSYSSNPWSTQQNRKIPVQQLGYSSVPKGNPWAPVGISENTPFGNMNTGNRNFTGAEKNPYTDTNISNQRAPFPSFNYQNQYTPFNNGFSNQFYDGSNGSFSTPFGNSFMPTNQFWPNGNNGSFPFMPW